MVGAFIIPPATKFGSVFWFMPVRLFVRLSVCPLSVDMICQRMLQEMGAWISKIAH